MITVRGEALYPLERSLGINGDLDAFWCVFRGWRSESRFDGEVTFALDFAHAHLITRLVIDPVMGLRLSSAEGYIEGTCTRLLKTEHRALCWTVRRDDMSGGVRVGVSGTVDSVRAALLKRSTDAQDDAESHRGREDGGHASHDSPDRVLRSGRRNDEPEQHVDEVDEKDGSVQVKTVTEHELPV